MILTTSLRVNAAFTALCAGICLACADWVTMHSALPNRLWTLGLGGMLACYVPMLLLAAARPHAWLVKTIIALDWAYVAIATIFLVTHWAVADATGVWLMLVSTSLVALFACLQARGLATKRQGALASVNH